MALLAQGEKKICRVKFCYKIKGYMINIHKPQKKLKIVEMLPYNQYETLSLS